MKLECDGYLFIKSSVFVTVNQGFFLESNSQNLNCATDIVTKGVATILENDSFIFGYKAELEIIDLEKYLALNQEQQVILLKQKIQRQIFLLQISQYKFAQEKIAYCLLFFLASKLSSDPFLMSVSNDIFVSNREIATITGLNRQTISREIAKLAKKQIIRRIKLKRVATRITEIIDIEKLQKIINY